jgi:hypothetical protein
VPSCQRFFRWYNTEHRHCGIARHTPYNARHTPYNVHAGQSAVAQAVRADVLSVGYTRNPERFAR